MKPSTRRRLALPLLLILASVIAACGGDDQRSTSSVTGNGVDRAFVAEMVPHHESAVDMAKVAQQRALHPEIERLAGNIVKTQNQEIEELNKLDTQLDQAGIEKGELDMPMAGHDMGMGGDTTKLVDAKPFDRAFIDMMIPHHQSAIQMARAQLEKGENKTARTLAQAIIDAQTKEIDEMNMWRVDWYGKLSPAGGVPVE